MNCRDVIALGILLPAAGCADDNEAGSAGDSGSTAATDTGSATTPTGSGTSASGSASASASGTTAGTTDGETSGSTGSATSVDDTSSGDGTAGSTDDGSGSSTGSASACPGFGMGGLLLHSTLDDAAAVTAPVVGAGMGEIDTTPADDFVPALDGDGLQIDADGEYLRFPVGSGGTDNIDLSQGTLDLCYRPSYDHTDGQDHPIFGTSDFQNGGIRVRKAAANNNNAFQVIAVDGNGSFFGQVEVPSNQYALAADEWYRITVTWDFGVGANEPTLRAYIDGVELAGNNSPTGPGTPPNPASDELIYIGAFSATDPLWNGSGVFDEVRIHDSALVP